MMGCGTEGENHLIKTSTSYLVLQFGDNPVSNRYCRPELKNSMIGYSMEMLNFKSLSDVYVIPMTYLLRFRDTSSSFAKGIKKDA